MAGFPTDINSRTSDVPTEFASADQHVAARGVGRPISMISIIGGGET